MDFNSSIEKSAVVYLYKIKCLGQGFETSNQGEFGPPKIQVNSAKLDQFGP